MNLFIYIRNSFLRLFGDIKVFRFPFFFLYDPGSYKVKGFEVRKIIDTVEKGDILVRGYSNYLDGFFIPGFFSHVGLYIGETTKIESLPEVLEDKFYLGKQVVIHAMAEGVFMEDIINFCKCDYLIILRRSEKIELLEDISLSFDGIYKKAINNLGKPYDFGFNFSNFHAMSCTEFVYDCCSDFLERYKIQQKLRWTLYKKNSVVLPDDFIVKDFDIVFCSKSVNEKKLNKIINFNYT